ncbi:alpha/beta fold hydrolase [Pseudaestuariivita sp.]|uniref:alpha/beta fold hydrolase n=1 Tax=Pseudaestuariivita sp. TaxID=2211669 RepID=UPI004059DF6D
MLHTLTFGAPVPGKPPVLIAHGLFGSARNWGVIAKRLSDAHHVVAVDMRNHGQSPHLATHSYDDLAEDLAEVIDAHGGQASVIGHSMGGKAAMMLALTRPDMVNRLLVADIAPVRYSHTQLGFVEAMQRVYTKAITSRSDLVAALAPEVSDPSLQSFFAQSFDMQTRQWRLNLDTLAREMQKIMDFPDVSGVYDGKSVVLTGAQSDYVTAEHRPRITALFPKARFVQLKDAGHWLHADQPRAFEAAARVFLDA